MEHHDGDGGISRTLYQGSKVGWLPRYLSHANAHGAPTHAMWTDFGSRLLPTLPVTSSCSRCRMLHHLQLPQSQCRLDPSQHHAGGRSLCGAYHSDLRLSTLCAGWRPLPDRRVADLGLKEGDMGERKAGMLLTSLRLDRGPRRQ